MITLALMLLAAPSAVAASGDGVLLLPDDDGCRTLAAGMAGQRAKVSTDTPPRGQNVWFCSTLGTDNMVCGNMAPGLARIQNLSSAIGEGAVLIVLQPSGRSPWLRVFGVSAQAWESTRELLILVGDRYQLRNEAFVRADTFAMTVVKLCAGAAVIPEAKEMARLRNMLQDAVIKAGQAGGRGR